MTPGARRVLEDLRDDEECDLVAEGIQVWCGKRRTNRAVLNQLINCMAVSVSWRSGNAIYYRLNDTGRAILRRPELEDELILHVSTRRGSFTIIKDRIRRLP